MKRQIELKWVLKQLKADLIGKDSYRGITLTYAWLANQFGHLSLGFIPSIALFVFLKDSAQFSNPIWSSVFVAGFWLLFETYNFLGPLLTKKQSHLKTVFVPKKAAYIFKPKWGNIAFDTFTDVCFFCVGAFSFSFFANYNKLSLIIICCLLLFLIFSTRYWFLTKMFQMYARYPFQFRLSQWNFLMNEENKQTIHAFLALQETGNHLLIFGNQNKGKTSLAVGLSNELSINHNYCLYKSALKLYACFFESENPNDSEKIWDWKTADVLIIDDITAGKPVTEELVNATRFLRFVDANKANRTILKNKNVIWVLGDSDVCKKTPENSWTQMLQEIGIPPAKIKSIYLS